MTRYLTRDRIAIVAALAVPLAVAACHQAKSEGTSPPSSAAPPASTPPGLTAATSGCPTHDIPVGFRLDEVPVAGGATLQEALTGGEDYALVFAAPDADGVMARFEECGLSLPTIMGECRPDVTERTLGGAPLPPAGWVHSLT